MIDIRKVPVVYLAGGMKNAWQDAVKKAVPGVIFIDPREHGLKNEEGYTQWDLAGVERADIVFGYMEAGNPSGAGLAVEFGWGGRAGKLLLLAEEPGYAQQRYFGMVRALAHAKFAGEAALVDAIAALKLIRDEGLDAYRARLARLACASQLTASAS
jgi:hypothetical protein